MGSAAENTLSLTPPVCANQPEEHYGQRGHHDTINRAPRLDAWPLPFSQPSPACHRDGGFRLSLTAFGQKGGFEWLLSAARETGGDKDGDGVTQDGSEADPTRQVLKRA